MTADQVTRDELSQMRRVVVRHFSWRREGIESKKIKDFNAPKALEGGEFRLKSVAFQPLLVAL